MHFMLNKNEKAKCSVKKKKKSHPKPLASKATLKPGIVVSVVTPCPRVPDLIQAEPGLKASLSYK